MCVTPSAKNSETEDLKPTAIAFEGDRVTFCAVKSNIQPATTRSKFVHHPKSKQADG